MFFKKIKTDIEDEYDNDFEDDWDDFDLEGGGFEDHTPKNGPREAVTQVTGSFFKGIRDSLLSPTTQKKLLRETLPEGYVSAYDDIKDVANSSKALYDTVKDEVKETHDTYLNELAPLAQKYDEKKQTKLSGKLARYANKARRSTPSNQISEEEMAYTAAANEIFGTALQKQSTEAMTEMASSFEQSSNLNQHLTQKQTELMVNQNNALNKSNAFNEQVALKFKQKSLELQFKHYFTARKHLEINTQQLDYLKSTIPDLVKNTGLPDAVKIRLSEQAQDIFKSKLIGKVQDFTGKRLQDVFRGVTEKAGELVKVKLNDARANAGMVSSAADMLGDDSDGFGISPKDLLRDFIFGQLGDWVVNKGIDKSKGFLKDRAENSDIDFEHQLSRFGYGKANLISTLKQMLVKGGTGQIWADNLLEQVDFSGIIGDRDNVLQKSISGHLEDQALFDLETKKSITTTIPGLLSEIHGELSTVRSSMGMPDPDDNQKLRMDWETGTLNTRDNIKAKVESKLFATQRKENVMKEAYDYLQAMGYDTDKVKQEKAVKDEQGNVILTEKDIIELAKAMKTQSYDTNQYFDEVEYARGHSLIDDEESRKNIAKFFTEHRKVDPSLELLKDSTEPIRALQERLKNNSTEQNNEAILLRQYIENMAKQGFEQQEYLKTLLHGNADILLETGAVGLASNGNILMDAKADTSRIFDSKDTRITPGEVYRGTINNTYGAQTRILEGDKRAQEKLKSKEQAQENKVKRAKLIQRLKDTGIIPSGVRELINNVGGDFSSIADKINDDEKDILFPVTAKPGTDKFFIQLTQREHLRSSVTREEIDACKTNWIAQNRTNRITGGNYDLASTQTISAVRSPLRSGINPALINPNGNNPPVPPVLPTIPPAVDANRQQPPVPQADNRTDNENTFNWNQFISDKLKEFFNKVLGKFNAQDYSNMANAVAIGVKEFLKTLAEKGAPQTDRARMSQERVREMDASDYNGEWLDALAEIMGYGVDRFSSNLGNMFGGFTENHFFGGKVGSGFMGSFKHFKRGGKVKKNNSQKRYFKEIQKAKQTIDNAISDRKFSPTNQSFSPLMQAYNREKQLGGDPQVIVASTGEQVLSTANGDAQAFEQAQKNGLWDKFKEFLNEKSKEQESDSEIKAAVKNLSREIQIETPNVIGNAKKTISETKQNAIVKLDEHGGSTALFIRDIRIALGNEDVNNLSTEDLKLTDQMKEAISEVSDIIGNKFGGGKQAVEEFWKNFETKCNTEGTSHYKALAKLKEIKKSAEDGKLGFIFKYIESKDIKSKLDRGLAKFKTALDINSLKNEDGKFDKTKVKERGKQIAIGTKDSVIGLASNVKTSVQNFDVEDAKEKLGDFKDKAEFELYKTQLRTSELKDKALDKASKLKDKAKNKARDIWYDKDGNPLVDFNRLKDFKLPNLQVGIDNQTTALATISRQIGELIRTNALIAIGTGSDPSEANAKDPDAITPFSLDKKVGKLKDKSKSFFSKLKDKFKKKEEEELDEDGKPIDPKTRFAKFKAWFKRKNSNNKELDPNEPKLVKRVGNKLVSVKANMGQWFRNRKNAGKDAGDNKKQFKDIYIKGQKDPVITGLELSKGMYTKANGEVINSIDEIEGAILDLSGKVVISQEEFDKGLVHFKNARGIGFKGLFDNNNKGGSSRIGKLFNFFKKDKENDEQPEETTDDTPTIKSRLNNIFKRDSNKKGGLLSGRSSLFIEATDVYIYGEKDPVLTRNGFKNQEYFDSKGKPITKTSEITGAVFDKDGNQLVSEEDYKLKRLVLRNGKPIQTKKRGLIGSTISLSGKAIGGLYKGSWWSTKKIFKGSWWLAKKPVQGAGWLGKKAFGVNMAEDVYMIGEEEPVLLAKDMKKGNYLDKETGKPITCFKDIKGAVVDRDGNTIITKEDVENKRLLTKAGLTRKSFASTATGGMFGIMGWGLKTTWRVTTKPFRMLFDNKGKNITKEKSEFIMYDVYVKGDDKPKLLAKEVPNNVYFNKEGEVVNKYNQLDKPVYDKDRNILISEEDIEKGLVKYDGTPIAKIGKGLFKGLFKTAGFGFGLSAGVIKGLFNLSAGTMKLFGGAFKFTTKVGKSLFSALGGNHFDVDGRDKYALMIQAQAAAVDKLEAIRIILDKRLEEKGKKFNDSDGDGVRDGSYLDNLRRKAKAKEEKDKEKKDKANKTGDKSKVKEAGKGLLDALDSPLTKVLIGGLMYTFGPQLFKAVTLSVRSALPSWLGGLSDERQAEIDRNGGIFATAFKEAKGHKKGDPTGKADDPTTETDESVQQEDSSGTSTLTKIAAAYLGYRGIKAGVKWGAKKLGTMALTRLGVGAAATAATGLGTAAAGGTLAGAAGAAGTAATGTALTGGLATAALGQGAAVTTAATAGSTIAGGTGVLGVLGAGATAAGAALMSPIGLAVLGALAVAGGIYVGYKVYKSLTKEDNHLTEWRMAQYGFKVDDKDHVIKILDLEDYLSKCTTKATNSQYAKINGQAQLEEALKIFGISTSNQQDMNKFNNWFHYRFKPFYLAWKTVMMRKVGSDDLTKVDQKLLKVDKISLINEVSLGQAGDEIYRRLVSPFTGEKEVQLSDVAIRKRKEEIITALNNIDSEKHDSKILQYGGGKNKTISSVEEDKRIQSIKTSGSSNSNNVPVNNLATKKDDKTVRPPEDSQSWWDKFLHGDRSKDGTAPGTDLNTGFGQKVSDFFGNLFGDGAGGGIGQVPASKGNGWLNNKDTILAAARIVGVDPGLLAGMAAQESAFQPTVRSKDSSATGLFQFIKSTWEEQMRKYASKFGIPAGTPPTNAAANALLGAQFIKDNLTELAKIGKTTPGDAYLAHFLGIGGAKKFLAANQSTSAASLNPKAAKANQSIFYNGGRARSVAEMRQYLTQLMYNKHKQLGVDVPIGGTGVTQGSSNQLAPGQKPDSAKTGNIVFNMGQNAGAATRTAIGKAWDTITGNNQPTKQVAPKPTTKPTNKVGVPPAAIAKPATTPSSVGGGLLGLTGISSLTNNLVEDKPVVEKSDKIDDTGDSNLSNLFSNFTSSNTGYVDNKGAFSVVPTANTTKAKPVAKDSTTLLAKVTKGTTISPVVNTGNFSVAKSGTGVASRGYKAASYARSHARGKSIGKCANYVATALLSSGYSFTRQPSAYMYHTNGVLTGAGFTQIDPNTQWIPGDIIVINRFGGHPHGHICIWDGRNWISDFIQKSYTPYSSGTPGGWALYRDSQALNGAKSANGWCQGSPGGGASVNTVEADAQYNGSEVGSNKPQRKYKTNTNLQAAVVGDYEKANIKGWNSNSKTNNTKPTKASNAKPIDVKQKLLSSNFNSSDMLNSGLSNSLMDNVGISEQPVNYFDINQVKAQLIPNLVEDEVPSTIDTAAVTKQNLVEQKSKSKIADNLTKEKQQEQLAIQAQIQHQQNQHELSSDSLGVLKEQLNVQKQMAKDISKLVQLMSTANKLAADGLTNNSQVNKVDPVVNKPQPFVNKHSRTVNTIEPVSMKIH